MVKHLGHFVLDALKRQDPNDICQIDAATRQKETYGSVLSRSIRLARFFKKIGLKPGDVLALGGLNHLDLRIPYYAALMTGLPVAGVDPFYKFDEIKALFNIASPKIAFCQYRQLNDYTKAAEELGIDVRMLEIAYRLLAVKVFRNLIITFDGEDLVTVSKIIEEDKEPTDDFEPSTFDTDKVYAWLVSTSGTTGVPKLATFTHPQIYELLEFVDTNFKKKELALVLSPVQWISAYGFSLGFLSLGTCMLQTSKPDSIEHVINIINEYRPGSFMSSPSTIMLILTNAKKCDLTCFDSITFTGAKVYKETVMELKKRLKKEARIIEAYGSTETLGPILVAGPDDPPGCTGSPLPSVEVKLVDPDTGLEIKDVNVPGELWIKGPRFSGYYKNHEETAKVFQDGWFKTGDLLYRDERGRYYFVDRIKMLIKYRNSHVVPTELEELIVSLEGVKEVAVTSVPDVVDGQRPVAIVVRKPGYDVTAQEIKELVIKKLSPSKQLRGGVIFVEELPKTSTGKVARAQLPKIASSLPRV